MTKEITRADCVREFRRVRDEVAENEGEGDYTGHFTELVRQAAVGKTWAELLPLIRQVAHEMWEDLYEDYLVDRYEDEVASGYVGAYRC